jgi:hypothetical protein
MSYAFVGFVAYSYFPLLVDSKQKLQDFLSVKVKELNELSERESLLVASLSTLRADVENDLSAQNEQVSHQLTHLKLQNENLNVEIADKKHGKIYIAVCPLTCPSTNNQPWK